MRVLFLFLFVLSLAPVYAQNLTAENLASGVKLIIDSDPSDAEVFLDGQLYGRTPLTVKELSPGTYDLRIKKEPFKDFVEKVECPALGYKEVFGVLSGKYALLNMESSVSGAEVFMGDSLLGKTPLENVHIPLGRHTITVKSKDYLDWRAQISAAPVQYKFKAVMKYMYGYVTLANNLDGSEIIIDDKKVDAPDLKNYKLVVGNHKVEVNNPSFNVPIEEEVLVGSETRTSLKIESGSFSFKPFLKSLLVPGLGQYQDNSKVKGITIFSGALLSGLLWLNSDLSTNNKIKEYNNAITEYYKPAPTQMLVKAHNKLASAYDAAKKANTMKNIAMSTFIAVYAYNLLDALIFHSTANSIIVTQEKPEGNSFNIGLSLAL